MSLIRGGNGHSSRDTMRAGARIEALVIAVAVLTTGLAVGLLVRKATAPIPSAPVPVAKPALAEPTPEAVERFREFMHSGRLPVRTPDANGNYPMTAEEERQAEADLAAYRREMGLPPLKK